MLESTVSLLGAVSVGALPFYPYLPTLGLWLIGPFCFSWNFTEAEATAGLIGQLALSSKHPCCLLARKGRSFDFVQLHGILVCIQCYMGYTVMALELQKFMPTRASPHLSPGLFYQDVGSTLIFLGLSTPQRFISPLFWGICGSESSGLTKWGGIRHEGNWIFCSSFLYLRRNPEPRAGGAGSWK